MRETINAQSAVWPLGVRALFAQNVEWRVKGNERVTSANYYTPRPYRNEYDRGSDKHGFVYTLNERDVCYVTLNGKEA